MNKMLNKLLATALFTAMIIGTMPIIMPAKAVPTQGFYILPTTVGFNTATTSVGFKFNVTVWIVTTIDTFSYQAKVKYNTTQIMADRADFTGVGKSLWLTPKSTTPVSAPIDNSTNPGVVFMGEALSGSDNKSASSGSLFWIEFEIMSAPTPGNTLTSSIFFDAADSFALDPDLATEPGFVNEPCAYSYAWAPPPKPHPEVINFTTNTFNEFGFWNGTTFDEYLNITNLSAGWFLTNATGNFTYNGTLLVVTSVVYNPLFVGPNSFANVSGNLGVFVQAPSSNPSGDVYIAKVTMMIIDQSSIPPKLFGSFYDSVRTLGLTLYSSFSSVGLIGVDPQPATLPIIVMNHLFVLPPYLSVSSATLGPGPVLGQQFNVTVSINNVVSAVHHLIGIQYRLQFNNTLLQAVAAYEGPYFPGWAALEPGSLGTFWFSSIEDPDGIWGPHVVMANMVFPNSTGIWNDPLPDGSGVVAIVTFQVMYQSFGEANITAPLTIADQAAVGLDNMVDQNLVDVPLMDPINGTYTITTNLPGRMIDEYGGAVNSGLIPLVGAPYLQFQAPYGGQGPNAPMDLVEPQSWVWLHANVTYNYWPVQFKNVAFEILMPNGTVYTKLSAFTDENGVATIGFRMPWPCDINTTSSSLIGVWTEISTVQLADVVISDIVQWHYDYLVHVWKVTTDMFQYNHGQCVQITFDYGSHAQQYYPALFVVSLVDELGVTVGIAMVDTTIGGTVFCQYKNVNGTTVEICIPKWAYAGIATIHINTFNWEPAQGGVAIAPEFVGPTIAIQPY